MHSFLDLFFFIFIFFRFSFLRVSDGEKEDVHMASTSPDHISGEKMSEKQQQQLALIAAQSLPPSRSSSKGSASSKVSKSGGKWARLAKETPSMLYTPKKTKQPRGRLALPASQNLSTPMEIEVQPSSSFQSYTVTYTDQFGQIQNAAISADV